MRIPIWVWFVPSAAFIVFTGVGSTVVDPTTLPSWAVAGLLVTVALAGVVAQGAAMDGRAATLNIARYDGVAQLARVASRGVLGLVQRDRTIPVVGPPGSVAAITTPDGVPGYGRIAGPTFRNEMLARGVPLISLNRPVAQARNVRVPVMLVVAERDAVAPVAAVEEVARLVLARVRVERIDAGHFDIYVGEAFERSVTAQVDFLASVVRPGQR